MLHVVSLNKHKLGAKLQGRGPGQNFMRYMVSRTPFLWLTAFCGTHLLSAQGGDAPPVSNFPATSAQPSAHTTAAPALLSTNAAPDITSELQQAANPGRTRPSRWCRSANLPILELDRFASPIGADFLPESYWQGIANAGPRHNELVEWLGRDAPGVHELLRAVP